MRDGSVPKKVVQEAHREQTHDSQDGSKIVTRTSRGRRQGEDLRAPRRQATSSFSQETTDAREEATEEKKTCELPDGNIAKVSPVCLRDW